MAHASFFVLYLVLYFVCFVFISFSILRHYIYVRSYNVINPSVSCLYLCIFYVLLLGVRNDETMIL